MNSNFLKQIEEENRILEQELQNLLNQKRQRVEKEYEDHDDNIHNFKMDKEDLTKIDEETDEEQTNHIEPHKQIECPQNTESVIDNLQDSINNYLDKRSCTIVDIQNQANKQINALEMRLSGTREALKCLEKEVKEKSAIIQNLQIDLAKKQKQIDNLQKNCQKSITPTRKEFNSEGFQDIKKQCKDWERKYNECYDQLKENKKYAQRLQELNQQLLLKLKQYECDKEQSNAELDQQKNINNEIYETNTNILIKYEQLIQTQQDQIQQQVDKYGCLQSKYDELKLNSEQFIQSSRDLKNQYEHMLNTLQSIANSY